MPLKKYRPTSAGRRFMTTLTFEEITKTTPEKGLTEPVRRTGGRTNRGRISVWFRGGGHKRRYRVVDFRRDKQNVPAKVAAIEYDPNRSARLALLQFEEARGDTGAAATLAYILDKFTGDSLRELAPSARFTLEGQVLSSAAMRGNGSQIDRAARLYRAVGMRPMYEANIYQRTI